jgi:hypothetical protein
MFPDSLIAKTFACAEKKIAHFGIAPHVLEFIKGKG